jgi:hypothetical protein
MPVTKKFKRIFNLDLVSIKNLTMHEENVPDNYLPWKYSFELATKQRSYVLYAPTMEERDLWVNGISRLLALRVEDPSWQPMKLISKDNLYVSVE